MALSFHISVPISTHSNAAMMPIPACLDCETAAATAFAVLHHIPGRRRRARLLLDVASLLRPGGRAVIATWQFLSSERLMRKIVPWNRIGLTATDVEAGDFLLDWKRGGEGLRYACALDETELDGLAQTAGCEVVEWNRAGGQSGQLSFYALLIRTRATDG